MRLAIGDVLRRHPIADRLRWRPWFYMRETTRLLAEKFLELVPGETELITALERQPFELSIYIGFIIDRFFITAQLLQFTISHPNLVHGLRFKPAIRTNIRSSRSQIRAARTFLR